MFKKRAFNISLILALSAVTIGLSTVLVDRVTAKPQQICINESRDEDAFGFISCPIGEEIPEDVLKKLPDRVRDQIVPKTQRGLPVPLNERMASLSPPGMPAAQPSSSATTLIFDGATFYCGAGEKCNAFGNFSYDTSMYAEWYLTGDGQADQIVGPKFCSSQSGCWWYTYWDPPGSAEIEKVIVNSIYAINLTDCWCDAIGICDEHVY